jgi:hypothetical protein
MFNLSQCKKYSLSEKCRWELVLDSCQKRWLGNETFAPDVFYEKDDITLKPYQFLLYRKKE